MGIRPGCGVNALFRQTRTPPNPAARCSSAGSLVLDCSVRVADLAALAEQSRAVAMRWQSSPGARHVGGERGEVRNVTSQQQFVDLDEPVGGLRAADRRRSRAAARPRAPRPSRAQRQAVCSISSATSARDRSASRIRTQTTAPASAAPSDARGRSTCARAPRLERAPLGTAGAHAARRSRRAEQADRAHDPASTAAVFSRRIRLEADHAREHEQGRAVAWSLRSSPRTRREAC